MKEQNVAIVFQRIVKFYGLEFEEDKYGIDLNYNGILYEKELKQTEITMGNSNNNNGLSKSRIGDTDRQLEVKDPLNGGKNITRNCYQFKLIKQIFKDIY